MPELTTWKVYRPGASDGGARASANSVSVTVTVVPAVPEPAAAGGVVGGALADDPPHPAARASTDPARTASRPRRRCTVRTRYLAHDVLGWATQTRPITADPARTNVAGQSLGGLAALFATQLMPERFGCALAQSGSFWWPANQEWLTRVVRAIPEPTYGVYLSVGTDEGTMRDQTHRMADALAHRGDPLHVTEYSGGHDLACWRVDSPTPSPR